MLLPIGVIMNTQWAMHLKNVEEKILKFLP